MKQFIENLGKYLVEIKRFYYVKQSHLFLKEKEDLLLGYQIGFLENENLLETFENQRKELERVFEKEIKKPCKILLLLLGNVEESICEKLNENICIMNLENKKLLYSRPITTEMDSFLEIIEKTPHKKTMGSIGEKLEVHNEFQNIKPWVTHGVIALNIFIFLILSYFGGSENIEVLEKFGSKVNSRILQGEYYRLLSSTFLHAGILHLFVNMFSLYNIGPITEKIYGHTKFLYLYLVAGIGGTTASLMFSSHPGVGASGAIFGVAGMILYFGQKRPIAFKRVFGQQLFIILALNVIFGFSVESIDNFAHLGGLFMGYLACYSVGIHTEKRYLHRQAVSITIIVLFIATAIAGARLMPVNQGLSYYRKGLNHIQEQNIKEALESLERAYPLLQKRTREEYNARYILAQLYIHEKEMDKAILFLEVHTSENQRDANYHYFLGLAYYEKKEIQKAKENLEKALQQKSDHEEAKALYEELYVK